MVIRGEAPLIVSIPHAGTEIPAEIETRLVSPSLARVDTDWWLERLYDFAAGLGATVVRTPFSRLVIDVNRDPSGASLYPGRETTGLCPTTTFDGEPLYRPGEEPGPAEIAERRARYFDPYHRALEAEIARLRGSLERVVLYDGHSIRSVIPRLFGGTLPHFNIGTNCGQSCAPELTRSFVEVCSGSPFSHVVDGRFRGGWITRHHGSPGNGVHAVQIEVACRSYLGSEPRWTTPDAWPMPYDPGTAAPARAVLAGLLQACVAFADAHS
jgi:formiminoglutamase